MWNGSSGKENWYEDPHAERSQLFPNYGGGEQGAPLQGSVAPATWTQFPVKAEPLKLKQQHMSVTSSLSFGDAERELEINEGKESHVPPKTPSKQRVLGICSKSPLKSGGKGTQAWQFLLSSVSRLSPKLSPVDKKPSIIFSSSKIFASPLKDNIHLPPTDSNIAPLESTPSLASSESSDCTKRARRTLFTPEVAGSFNVFPEKKENDISFKGFHKNGNPLNQKASSKLSKICEKTNSLFRVVSAVHSPQKAKSLDKNKKFNKIFELNSSLRESKTGQPFVDMLYELSARGMELLLLKHLDDYELFCCSLVCHQWSSILRHEISLRKQIVEAERRSFLSLDSTQEDIENLSPHFPHSHASKFNSSHHQISSANYCFSAPNRPPFDNFSPLTSGNDRTGPNLFCPQQTPVSDFSQKRELKLSKSQYLVPEARSKTLNSELASVLRNKVCQSTSLLDLRSSTEDRLVKCPSCMSRAKVTPIKEEGICFNEMCQYRFCSRCDSPYHGSSRCVSGLGSVSIEEITSPTKLQAMVTEMNSSGSSERERNTGNVSTERNNLCVSKPKLQSSNSSLCSTRSRNSLRRL